MYDRWMNLSIFYAESNIDLYVYNLYYTMMTLDSQVMKRQRLIITLFMNADDLW